MMYVAIVNQPVDAACYVGYRINCIVHEVLSVQCDGDELAHAMDILGIEKMPARVFTFYGDQARTVVGNWSNVKYVIK